MDQYNSLEVFNLNLNSEHLDKYISNNVSKGTKYSKEAYIHAIKIIYTTDNIGIAAKLYRSPHSIKICVANPCLLLRYHPDRIKMVNLNHAIKLL